MTPLVQRGAPREGAPKTAAILTRCSSDHSEITGKIQPSVAAEWLARRAGLSLSAAAAIASANSWGVGHG